MYADTDQARVRVQREPEVLIDGKEWLWLAGISLIALMLSTLPYMAGYSSQTPENVYFGAVFDRMDYAVHLATMQLGANGEWAYRFQFTTETHEGAYVKLFYIFLGQVSRLIGLSVEATYQLSRLTAGSSALVLVYAWIVRAFSSKAARLTAFLLAVFGSGLGWLQFITGFIPQSDISPIDFWLIDPYIFFGLMVFPHFSAVTALLIGMLVAFHSALIHPAWRKWALLASAGVLLQSIQPYAPVLADVIMLGTLSSLWIRKGGISWRQLLSFGVVCGVQIPLFLYNASIFYLDPVWSRFTLQNVTLSPPPAYYLWGFGILWPPAIAGAWRVIKLAFLNRDPGNKGLDQATTIALIMVLTWTVVAFLLAFGPYNLQRRFMHAYILPLSVLAAYGLFEVALPWLMERRIYWLAKRGGSLSILLVSLAAISSIYLSFGNTLLIHQQADVYFEPRTIMEAVDWLKAKARHDEAVLASERTAQVVAARSGLKVYLGHPIETLSYEDKRKQVENFFSDQGHQEGPGEEINIVFYGPHERELTVGDEWSPPGDFEEVFENDEVRIFQRAP